MTTIEHHRASSSYLSQNDLYDPEDVGLRDSPLLQPIVPNLQPSPSPPPMVPLPEVSPDCSPDPSGRKGSRPKNRPSLGDAVLAHFMGNGKHLDVSRKAGDEPLPSDDEAGDESVRGVEIEISTEDNEERGKANGSDADKAEDVNRNGDGNKEANAPPPEKDGEDHLEALALNALRHIARNPSEEQRVNGEVQRSQEHATGEAMEGVRSTVPSIQVDRSQALPSGAVQVKAEAQASPTGELPPIRQHSPTSALPNGSSASTIKLPSITDMELNHLGDTPTPRDASVYSQSPPAPHPPLFAAVQGSPPKSPIDFRALPSPGRGGFSFYNNNQHRRMSQSDGPQYSSAGDYSSSTETPGTDYSASTPAMGIDRMSIDGITNPQIGGFQCTYPGCTAQPFQTQYLLNSHANVHSQNRPHYCSVKGCPRSEGGKGFKRKNEMIRHGLVHDSPGYVCPFCPDREHKYPRPDNLQRHVRVHHGDKDKDDPQLRDVLAQRPEGPSRGRRRRGGTT